MARYRHDCCRPPDHAPEDLIGKDAVAIIRSGFSTNDFITAGYRLAAGRERNALGMEIDEEQAFTILKTAYIHAGTARNVSAPALCATKFSCQTLFFSIL